MKKSIMIVDDSQIICKRIERHLQDLPLEVVATASDGEAALQLFIERQPDLITMDLTMPQMDGLRCIHEICTRSADVRILVISALADKATGIKAIKAGARGFLYKPFTDRELREALMEILSD